MPIYTSAGEVKAFARIPKEDLGYTAEQEYDTFINGVIILAEGILNDYMGQSFTSETVPPAVRLAAIQLCSNLLHIILQRKLSPVVQTRDYTIRLVLPEAFTQELKNLLTPYRKLNVKLEGEPAK